MVALCRTRLLRRPTPSDADPHRERRILLVTLLGFVTAMSGMACLLGAVAPGSGSSGSSAQAVDFNRDIAPILQAYCVKCHGSEKPQAQLRLDSETAVLRGGISGKVVVPGKSGDSLLIKRLLG